MSYFDELATAFVRGTLAKPEATIDDGLAAGLRLHKFKDNTTLPRVQRVLGQLQGVAPESLLDVGSGRGTFLWPLLHRFPELPVTAIEASERRAHDLMAVRRGGVHRLNVARMDVARLALRPGAFDVVTMLEVLEHLPDPQAALTGVVACARRFVLVSVPSVPDDNPEHLHLFTPAQLERMAQYAGATRFTIEHVLNHRIALLRVHA